MAKPLTERQREVLECLASGRSLDWFRPMDCGGTDGSHHGATLRQLYAKGYATRNANIGSITDRRRVNHYRITERGHKALMERTNG